MSVPKEMSTHQHFSMTHFKNRPPSSRIFCINSFSMAILRHDEVVGTIVCSYIADSIRFRNLTFPGWWFIDSPLLKSTSFDPGHSTISPHDDVVDTSKSLAPLSSSDKYFAALRESACFSKCPLNRNHCLRFTDLTFPVSVDGMNSVGMPYPWSAYRSSIGVPKWNFVRGSQFDNPMVNKEASVVANALFGRHAWMAHIRNGIMSPIIVLTSMRIANQRSHPCRLLSFWVCRKLGTRTIRAPLRWVSKWSKSLFILSKPPRTLAQKYKNTLSWCSIAREKLILCALG